MRDTRRPHIKIALQAQGPLPHPCYWCTKPVRTLGRIGVVHHVDHNPKNNVPSNLVFAHQRCHVTYHSGHPDMRERKASQMREFYVSDRRHDVACPYGCGKVCTPGPMARHIKAKTCKPKTWVHGTVTTYTNHKCRCKKCSDAMSEVRASRRKQKLPATVEHGKASTYGNWGCRCRPCTDAASEDARNRRNRK